MIYEKPFDEKVLDEALVFINTSKQAARIKCATIGWNGLEKIIRG
jgi:nitrogen fixation NifU-like protein